MQCSAKSKRSGEQCRRDAVAGYNVCSLHGGKTPRGVASANWKSGRYSQAMPARLRERYQEALHDPDLVAMRSDLALIDSRLLDLLERADSGEAGMLWERLHDAAAAFKRSRASGDVKAMNEALHTLFETIDDGRTDAATWAEIRGLVEQRRKVSVSEQKRLVLMRAVFTAEQGAALLAAIVGIIDRSVTDRATRTQISNELMALADSGQF